jgi:hypothetical protein
MTSPLGKVSHFLNLKSLLKKNIRNCWHTRSWVRGERKNRKGKCSKWWVESHPMWFQCFLFRWCKFPAHFCPWACLTGELIAFCGCRKEKRSERAPWEAQVPPLLLSPTQCSFPTEFMWASHDAFSHILQLSPLKPRLDFLLHHETSWTCDVELNETYSWCFWSHDLSCTCLLPDACCLCLKFNSNSCCSSSTLFQSTVSSCKHQKNFECKRTTIVFGCGLQRGSLKERVLLNPAHLREKPIWKIVITVEAWDRNLYCHEKSGDISYYQHVSCKFTLNSNVNLHGQRVKEKQTILSNI